MQISFDKMHKILTYLGGVIWLCLAIAFYFFVHRQEHLNLIDVVELALYPFILFCTYKIYRSTESRTLQITQLFYSLSIIGLFLTDLFFYLVIYVWHGSPDSNFYASFYLIPFLLSCTFGIVFWFRIVKKYVFRSQRNLIIPLFFLVLNIILMVLFVIVSHWEINLFSYLGFTQILGAFLELILFDLALLALVSSKNKGIYFLSSGTIILIASNFWEMYLFENLTMNVFDYADIFWLLGLFFMLLGLIFFVGKKDFDPENWLRPFNGIKSQIALWTFGISVTSFLLFFLFGYPLGLINHYNLVSLPFFIMIYSVIVILLSNFIGNKLESPFRQLQNNIDFFMNAQPSGVSDNFFIDEFVFLQNFVKNAFETTNEKNKAKKAIAELALQVAHDIRSPVSAILMLSKDCVELPEEQRISLRNAANRIEDIANNLLEQHQTKKTTKNKVETFLISSAINAVLSEKKVAYKNFNISFIAEFSQEAYFAFIKTDPIEFKRMISNIVNNSVEAINGHAGCITINCTVNDNNVFIKIKDNGPGMPIDTINKLKSNEPILSEKEKGHGLGWTHAYNFMKKSSASFEIISGSGNGTEIILTFQRSHLPCWIINKIELMPTTFIIILDDDISIHGAWDKRLLPYKEKFENLKIEHFTNADKCIEFIKNLTPEVLKKVLLLTDYELLKQDMTGLDVISMSGLKHAILVTSHHENQNIVKKAILLNAKILPKTLASEVPIVEIKKQTLETSKFPDLVILEDNKEFASVLGYLYKVRGKSLDAYSSPYDLIDNLDQYNKEIKICLDYDLGCPINGVELSYVLFQKGFKNIYLATGFHMKQENLPEFLKLLNDKMSLLNL